MWLPFQKPASGVAVAGNQTRSAQADRSQALSWCGVKGRVAGLTSRVIPAHTRRFGTLETLYPKSLRRWRRAHQAAGVSQMDPGVMTPQMPG